MNSLLTPGTKMYRLCWSQGFKMHVFLLVSFVKHHFILQHLPFKHLKYSISPITPLPPFTEGETEAQRGLSDLPQDESLAEPITEPRSHESHSSTLATRPYSLLQPFEVNPVSPQRACVLEAEAERSGAALPTFLCLESQVCIWLK